MKLESELLEKGFKVINLSPKRLEKDGVIYILIPAGYKKENEIN